MSPAPVIEIRDLRKVYAEGTPAEVVALRGVSLTVNHGEFVAIMGPSGSGKSTLMNMIGCLDTPTSGTYRCDGVDVAALDAAGRAKLRLQKIGFVFQGFHLLTRQSALENVMLPLAYAGVPRGQRRPLAEKALAEVGLGARAGHTPSAVSTLRSQLPRRANNAMPRMSETPASVRMKAPMRGPRAGVPSGLMRPPAARRRA